MQRKRYTTGWPLPSVTGHGVLRFSTTIFVLCRQIQSLADSVPRGWPTQRRDTPKPASLLAPPACARRGVPRIAAASGNVCVSVDPDATALRLHRRVSHPRTPGLAASITMVWSTDQLSEPVFVLELDSVCNGVGLEPPKRSGSRLQKMTAAERGVAIVSRTDLEPGDRGPARKERPSGEVPATSHLSKKRVFQAARRSWPSSCGRSRACRRSAALVRLWLFPQRRRPDFREGTVMMMDGRGNLGLYPCCPGITQAHLGQAPCKTVTR